MWIPHLHHYPLCPSMHPYPLLVLPMHTDSQESLISVSKVDSPSLLSVGSISLCPHYYSPPRGLGWWAWDGWGVLVTSSSWRSSDFRRKICKTWRLNKRVVYRVCGFLLTISVEQRLKNFRLTLWQFCIIELL